MPRSFGLICPLLVGCLSLVLACSGEGDTTTDEPGGDAGSAGTTSGVGGSGAGGSAVSTAGSGTAGSGTSGSADNGGTANNEAGTTSGGSEMGGSTNGGSEAGGSTSGGSSSGGAGSANGGSGGAPMEEASIDFARWQLQLPTGSGTSPTTIQPAELLKGFSNDYFYKAADGAQVYMSPKSGITTPGSQHCRTEMREMNPGGGAAAWASSGHHVMTVNGKVTKIGSGSIAIGQLFNGTDSIPLCEMQFTKSNKFVLLYEEAKGGGTTIDLKTSGALGTRYTFTLEMTDGKLRVTINDKEVYTRTPSSGILDNKFYFKAGNYDQSATSGTPDKTPYSVVENYSVKVVHEN